MWDVKSHPSTDVCVDSQPGMGIRLEDSASCFSAMIQVLGTLWYSHASWDTGAMVFVVITHQLCNKDLGWFLSCCVHGKDDEKPLQCFACNVCCIKMSCMYAP